MARLQILELPEAAGDERAPFVLVVDQYEPAEATPSHLLHHENVAEQIGARAVLAFECTIEIPANDTTAYLATSEEQAEPPRSDERAIQAEEKLKAFMDRRRSVEDERKDALLSALGMDQTRDWDDIRNAAAGLRKQRDAQADAIERVRQTSTKPEAMNARQEHPSIWLHGYGIGVRAAKAALSPRDEPTSKPTDA